MAMEPNRSFLIQANDCPALPRVPSPGREAGAFSCPRAVQGDLFAAQPCRAEVKAEVSFDLRDAGFAQYLGRFLGEVLEPTEEARERGRSRETMIAYLQDWPEERVLTDAGHRYLLSGLPKSREDREADVRFLRYRRRRWAYLWERYRQGVPPGDLARASEAWVEGAAA